CGKVGLDEVVGCSFIIPARRRAEIAVENEPDALIRLEQALRRSWNSSHHRRVASERSDLRPIPPQWLQCPATAVFPGRGWTDILAGSWGESNVAVQQGPSESQ